MHDPSGSRTTRPALSRLAVLALVALSAFAGAAAHSALGGRDRAAGTPAGTPTEEPQVRSARLECLTDEALASLRQSPQSVVELFAGCCDELRSDLGPAFADLGERDLQYVFCSVAAHSLAPYGQRAQFPPENLLRAETLNCANYGVLADFLAGHFPGAGGDGRRFAYVGFDGGAVGNHQMVFLRGPEGASGLLLDPTIGAVMRADFDGIFTGRPVPAAHIVTLGHREDIAASRKKIVAAMVHGRCKPSDLLYYCDGMSHFLDSYGTRLQWPTPAAVGWRARKLAAKPAAAP